MNLLERLAYSAGRIIGFIAAEVVNSWIPQQAIRAAVGRDFNNAIVGPKFVAVAEMAENEPAVKPTSDDELDWLGWAVPAISEVLITHGYIDMPGLEANSLIGTCECHRADPVPMDSVDWIDHVTVLIAETLACDPARAIAALWNHQLKQGTSQ